jgi:hypothetical protein
LDQRADAPRKLRNAPSGPADCRQELEMVNFPAPFGPIMPSVLPGETRNDTPSTAQNP